MTGVPPFASAVAQISNFKRMAVSSKRLQALLPKLPCMLHQWARLS